MKTLITTLNSKFIHLSLAIRYLKKYVEDDYDINMKEFTINMHSEDILIDVYKEHYDVVIFSVYIWNYKESLTIAKKLKQLNEAITIVFGGPEVSYNPGKELEDNEFIDFIMFGEGEETFKEFLNALFHQKKFDKIKGLAYRDAESVVVNEKRPLIADLDKIPFVYDNFEALKNKIIYYESSRGCPFNCSYCLSSSFDGVRYFSMDRIKKDLKIFLDHNVEQVKFVDRTFNANKEHYFEIIKFLNENDNGVSNFHFEITAILLDDDVIDYLKNVRPGLFQFEIGVQSTHLETLVEINRKMDFDTIAEKVNKILSYRNIHVHLDLIAGLPNETFKDFLQSFSDVYALGGDKLQLGFLKLLKGSELRNNYEDYSYVFDASPPYEVFYNQWISFDEMIILKGIESLLDHYYNSNYFDQSIDFIIHQNYNSSHEFYLAFYHYWEEHDLFEFKHSKFKLYKILLDFYQEKFDEKVAIFKEILKYDFILNKNRKIEKLFDRNKINQFRHKCHLFLQSEENLKQYLPHYVGKNAKFIIKRVHFEIFDFDVIGYINSGFKVLNSNEQAVLFDYSQDDLFNRSITHEIELG